MSKRFVLILVACVAIFLGLLFLGDKDAGAPSEDKAEPTNHSIGAGTAGVTLVAYEDFQCPACAQYFPVIKQIQEKYGDKITFQYRHFPLTQLHPNAFAAHRAAEAAGNQNKFFEMHDLLYQRQSSWERSNQPGVIFEQYAQELNLDMDKYRREVDSAEINRVIRADMNAGNALGLTATPSFILNGQKIEENPREAEGFFKLIDDALKAKAQP